MIGTILKKVFGTRNERELKRIAPVVERINSFEPGMQSMRDEEFSPFTVKLKERLSAGEGVSDILPEAFAAVREVAKRKVHMRHFDVQLIGGVVLHEGKIGEMKTGEGKTLVATLPLYLNALTGKGCHLVTVNDYLAKRDTRWMGPIYHTLGLRVGCIQHEASFLYDPQYAVTDQGHFNLRPCSRKEAYLADITYGTNNEFGFDYLRDNMKFSLADYVQRDFNYGIVDEVDSILIDEARTPLIISGPAEESTNLYYILNRVALQLKRDQDYTGAEKVLNIDNLYDPRHIEVLHHLNQALKAHNLFQLADEYIVKDDQVIIVDE